MSEKIFIDVDITEGVRKVEALDNKIQDTKNNLKEAAEATELQTKKSFNEVLGMMRASYAMVSGLAQVVGGDLGQIFSSVYGIAVSAIGTYQAIAAAMAASGVGTFQAILMTSSLITAGISLIGIMTGQKELSQRVSGLNMALHGIGGLFTSYSM